VPAHDDAITVNAADDNRRAGFDELTVGDDIDSMIFNIGNARGSERRNRPASFSLLS